MRVGEKQEEQVGLTPTAIVNTCYEFRVEVRFLWMRSKQLDRQNAGLG